MQYYHSHITSLWILGMVMGIMFVADHLVAQSVSDLYEPEYAYMASGQDMIEECAVVRTGKFPSRDSVFRHCTYVVQVGAFHQYHHAMSTVDRIELICRYPIHVNRLWIQESPLYKVVVGRFDQRDQAADICRRLRDADIDAFVTCVSLGAKM